MFGVYKIHVAYMRSPKGIDNVCPALKIRMQRHEILILNQSLLGCFN